MKRKSGCTVKCTDAALSGLVLFLSIASSTHAQVQPNVDAGTLLQQGQNQPNLALPQPTPDVTPRSNETSPAQSSKVADTSKTTVVVRSFNLTGNISVFTPEQIQAALSSYVNRALSLVELQQAAISITQLYRQSGYFLARAFLPRQDVTSGTVTIEIVEGVLDKIDGVRISSEPLRLKSSAAIALVSAASPQGQPLNQGALERGLLLLNDIPGIAATANLEPGSTPGSSRIALDLKEAPVFSGNVVIDNYGSRYTGSDRLNANLSLNDPLGHGEQLTLQATQALRNSESNFTYARVGYSQPLGDTGLRAGMAYSSLFYNVGQELANLRAKGSAQNWNVNLRYPIIRGRESSLFATLAYDRKNLYNEANGARTSDKLVDAANVGLNFEQTDALGGGGYNFAGIAASSGSLDLGRDAANFAADQGAAGARTQGAFQKINWNATRLQRLSQKFSFAAMFSGQSANKNLDTSERFQLGGPSGIRAYGPGEGLGDEGMRATLETRYFAGSFASLGDVNLQAFYDWGSVRQFKDPSAQTLTTPNVYNLSGLGFGITVSRAGRFEAKAHWAQKIGSNPAANASGNDSDGTNNSKRLWLSLAAFF